MTRFKELLYTDFDGNSTTDDVLHKAFDDPRHMERVPGLVELMNDSAAPEMERFIALYSANCRTSGRSPR
ncbi:hypothetical protein LE181_24455 [Streptomyces sp. SCA3-4]|uniref:hypothetical protein n=1 Tax=Streptomyces sichuanensis TaxID=2871810 RepID=UPI001CE27C97|nr:hypothetical protein [Streptomyces sichuanensis]MCA6095304.1 hypothetical protein [Streptomyces sichuanensis]